jgi:hypothetical protein
LGACYSRNRAAAVPDEVNMTEKAGSLRWNESKGCWQVRLALPPGAVVEWVELPAEIGRADVARAKAAAKVVKKADARIDRLERRVDRARGAPNKGKSR